VTALARIDIVPEKTQEDTVKTVKHLSLYVSTHDAGPQVIIRRRSGTVTHPERAYRPTTASRYRVDRVVNRLVRSGAWRSSVAVGGQFLMVNTWPAK
jgi:hypothetical protein